MSDKNKDMRLLKMTNEQIFKLTTAANLRDEAAQLMSKASKLEKEALGIIDKPE